MFAQLAAYAMGAVLIGAMVFEARTGRIPNWLTLVPVGLFVILLVVSADRSAMLWQLGLGAVAFAIGILLYATAGMGAGAVKLLAGVALFVPLSKGWLALGVFVGAIFASAILIKLLRKSFASEDSEWLIFAKAVLPMSWPIGAAGLAVLFVL